MNNITSKRPHAIKKAFAGLIMLALVLLPQFSILAPQTSASSPTDTADYSPPSWTSQAPTPAQYLDAKYVYTYVLCFAADPIDDPALNSTKAVRRKLDNATSLNLIQGLNSSDEDRMIVGYDISQNDSDGAADCDDLEGGVDGHVKKLWGNNSDSIKDFIHQFYYSDDNTLGLSAFDNAFELLGTPFFDTIHDGSGEFGTVSLASAFARCFKDKGTVPGGGGQGQGGTGIDSYELLNPDDKNDKDPSDGLVGAFISSPGQDDGDGTADREGLTNCHEFIDNPSKMHTEDIVKMLDEFDVTTAALKSDSRILYGLLEERGQTEEQTASREEAKAAILPALSSNIPQVTSCMQEVGNPKVTLRNMTTVPLTFKDSTGKDITVESGNTAEQVGDDAKLRMVSYLQSAAPGTWTTLIADWLIDPELAGENGVTITPALGTPSTPAGMFATIVIPPESLAALNGCLVKNVPGIKEALISLGKDLTDIEAAYADVTPTETTEEEGADDCLSTDDLLGWFICPMINLIDSVLETIEDRIQDMLVFTLSDGDSEEGLRNSWNIFRSLATIIITVGFLLALVVKAVRGE